MTPAAAPMPAMASAPASAAASGRVTAAPAPLAAARPDAAPPADLVRTAESAPATAAGSPPLETHVEIPAKFLPGGAGAGDDKTPRKSILPPLPSLADKATDAEQPAAARPARAAAAPAPTRVPASTLTPAAAPEPSAVERRTPTPPVARPAAETARREPPRPSSAVAPERARASAATPSTPRASRPADTPRGGDAAQVAAAARAVDTPRPPRPAPASKPAAPTPAASPASADSGAIRVTRLPASAAGWSYEGDTGPDNWGRLRPEWRLCAEGTRQSPIDLRDGIAVDLAPVQFDYRRTGFRIRDTGNLLQVDVGEGMGISVRGVRYALERFTLHRPSQDRVGGMAHDMAIYLEHRSEDGRQAILSLLLSAGGEAHPLLQTLWSNLPLDRGREFAPDAVIDLAQLVPADPGHFLFSGSLPMPPCTEDVLWVVMKQPLPIANDQLEVFARLYPRNGRPIQPANGRPLLESR